MLTHDVVIWGIRKRKRTKPYQLRWKVGKKTHSRSFLSSALADDFRADLIKAAKRGDLFDSDIGLPESMLTDTAEESKPPLLWFDFVHEYVQVRWPGAAAKSRASIVDGLSAATISLTNDDLSSMPPTLIRAAVRAAVIPSRKPEQLPAESEDEVGLATKLLASGTSALSDLADRDVAKRVWDALEKKLDGSPAKRDTVLRRRRVLNTALEYAVERGYLPENPLRRIKRTRIAYDSAIDRRVVANPRQVNELLTALSYVGSWKRGRGRRLVAFFATLYYAGARPSEAIGLRDRDCDLPERGWGALNLSETRPSSGKQYTDSGEVHDQRGLKQRDRHAIRTVPIPPKLVRILRNHVDEFGTAPDGRLFRNERGGVLGSSTYSRAWKEARSLAFTPRQVASPLAGTAYDLRHAALSTWLNGGVDSTEVAERAGNSVEVLLARYAKCLDARRDRNNKLIERALRIDG